MTGSDYLGVLSAMDRLLESVAMSPDAWNEQALEDWASETMMAVTDRDVAKEVRRLLRIAVRIRDHWMEPDRPGPADWRSRVDIAVAGRGWRPSLGVARLGLEAAPCPELFEEVRHRFRTVNHEPWMEGVAFEEWIVGNP
jgi:hypothetical protein